MAKKQGKTLTTAQVGYYPPQSIWPGAYPDPNYNNPNRFNALTNPSDYYSSWEWRLWLMRQDPTIALLRQLWVSPILSAGWSIQAADDVPDNVVDYANEELKKIQDCLIVTAGLGCLDWGWAPFEQIFEMRSDGLLGIKKIKSLLQQMTIIETDESTGEYLGLSQDNVVLDLDHALLFNFDPIGTNWYGQAPMKAAEKPWLDSCKVDESQARLNARIAGEHWVIYYPVGTTEQNGKDVDNFEIANSIMEKMLADGSCTLPNEIRSELNILNGDAGTHDYQSWRIELLSSGDTSAGYYLDQNKYNDTLKARALGFPERSVFEGQFGTKAEAGVHADAAVQGLEKRSEELAAPAGKQVIQPLIEFNFGEQWHGMVEVKANPIVDSTLQLWLELYQKFLSNSDVLIEEFDNINMREVREKLGVPQYDEGTENPDPLKEDIDSRPTPRLMPPGQPPADDEEPEDDEEN